MIANKKFAEMVRSIISDSVSTDELDREISANPNEGSFYTKLTTAGYNSADVLIINTSKLENLKVSSFALELPNELISTSYQGYTLYQQDSLVSESEHQHQPILDRTLPVLLHNHRMDFAIPSRLSALQSFSSRAEASSSQGAIDDCISIQKDHPKTHQYYFLAYTSHPVCHAISL